MKPLPEALIYEEGLKYWPYRVSLQMVLDYIVAHAPQKASLLDVMCGPGCLLGQIAQKRGDLSLKGVDIDERYVSYGSETYPGVSFEQHDVLDWFPGPRFDVVVCTGAVHHIRYEEQEMALASIASMVKPRSGLVIISDCYVDDYSNETERKLAAAKLGYEYLTETIRNGASDKVVGWTADILSNDVLMHEFKPSLAKRLAMLNMCFNKVTTFKPWPTVESGYGDYVHICSVM
jgi:2-polyprenyl-3-methyl-5-hydroxy-6-metoxy-1,4-benzoquinol methylase